MCNCDRQCIGGVIWFWDRFQLQQRAHHILYLTFICSTITSYSLFDFIGSVFKRFDACFLQTEHDHAAGLSHSEGGFDIALKE